MQTTLNFCLAGNAIFCFAQVFRGIPFILLTNHFSCNKYSFIIL